MTRAKWALTPSGDLPLCPGWRLCGLDVPTPPAGDAPIYVPRDTPLHSAAPATPRAIGAGAMAVRADEAGRTRLVRLRQSGATKLVLPRSFRPGMEAILVNTAGGITGGDQFDLDVEVGRGATLTLTTQAAERAYRAQPAETGTVTTRLRVAPGATMVWVPQELILFDRCALTRRLSIDLQQDARLLMVEPMIFGRQAMGETLRDIRFRDRIEITRDGTVLYVDGLVLRGDATAHLARPAVADGAGAMASVVFVCPSAESHLDAVRAMLPPRAGVTLLAENTLALRLLATDGYTLRQQLIPVLENLSGTPLPTSWRL